MPHRTATRLTAVLAAALAALAAVTASAALVAGPAHADSQQRRDARGDVGVVSTAKPGYRTLDVVRYRNTFENGFLTLRTTLRDRARRGWAVGWFVADGGGDLLGTGVVFPDDGGGVVGGFEPTDDSECNVLPSASGDTVLLSVPVGCLRDARSVRIANYTFARVGRGGRTAIDDANRDRALDDDTRVKVGPRLGYSLG